MKTVHYNIQSTKRNKNTQYRIALQTDIKAKKSKEKKIIKIMKEIKTIKEIIFHKVKRRERKLSRK